MRTAAACRSVRMEDAVSLDQLQGLGERLAAMQAVPGSGVAMPLDVEAVRGEPVQADEGRIELFPAIVREA